MAQKVTVTLVDDLTGDEIGEIGTAGETVEFGLDGMSYEIDLSEENAGKLRTGLQDYVTHARRVKTFSRPASRAAARSSRTADFRSREELRAIRDWAKQNGHTVAERGRIAADIVKAYDEAHKPALAATG